MPEQTALRKLKAERAYVQATTEQEERAAMVEYLAAEKAHNEAIGVDSSTFWTRLAGGMVAFLLVIVLLVSLNNSHNAAATADEAQDTAHAVAVQSKVLAGVQSVQRKATIEQCERGNETRLATLRNFHNDIVNLEADRNLLETLLPPGELLSSELSAKRRAIDAKRATIRDTIAAQAPVAVEPGSPEVDCAGAFLASFHP